MTNGDTRPPQLTSWYVGAVPPDANHAQVPDSSANGPTTLHYDPMTNAPLRIFIPTSQIFVPMAEKRKRYGGHDGGAIRIAPYNKRLYDAKLNRTILNADSTVIPGNRSSSTIGRLSADTLGTQQRQEPEAECFLPDETDEMIIAVAKFMAAYPNSNPLEVYQLFLSASARRQPAADGCVAARQSTSSSISVIKPTFVSAGHVPHNDNLIPSVSHQISPQMPARNVIRHSTEYSNTLKSTLGLLGSSNSAFCCVNVVPSTSSYNDGVATVLDYSSRNDPVATVSEEDVHSKINSSAKDLTELSTIRSIINYATNFNETGSQNGVFNPSASFDNKNPHQQKQQQNQHKESLLSSLLSAKTTRKSPYVPESRTELQSGLAGSCAAVPSVFAHPSISSQFTGSTNTFIDDPHVKPYSTTLPSYYRPENSLAHLDSPPKLYSDFSCLSTSAYSSSRYSATSPSANGTRSDSSDRSSRPSASPHSATSSSGETAGYRAPADPVSGGKPDTERYKDRRRRNNEAAKRCRANRRAIFEFRSRRIVQLERENVDLRTQMERLRAELDRFRAAAVTLNSNFSNNDSNNNTLIVQQQQQQQLSL